MVDELRRHMQKKIRRYKISDFFETKAYFEYYYGRPVIYFYYGEQDEEYLYDYLNKNLLQGDHSTITFELIKDWLEDHKDELDYMFETEEPFYIKDIV